MPNSLELIHIIHMHLYIYSKDVNTYALIYIKHAVRGTVSLNLVNRFLCQIITLLSYALYSPFLRLNVPD